ncbi:MAG: hypothetical protein GPJ54_11935 [Candidatus Heimdallarchaeota archaeon]|nr:hypothetical protein [Candidatus Heimdallarchaeota archaeon]
MARKSYYQGEIIQIRVRQSNLYHRQWAIKRYDRQRQALMKDGRPQIYVVSETNQKEDGTFVRKHQWICGCMDWTRRRQKLTAPNDRCKHVDAVIRMDGGTVVVETTNKIFKNITRIQNISDFEFGGYTPKRMVICSWSGRSIQYFHIITLPPQSIPISVEDTQGHNFIVGYIKGNSAYLAIAQRDLQNFDQGSFFSTLAKRSYSPKESEMLLKMEEQRDRLAKNFGSSATSELMVFDGEFSDKDMRELDKLRSSGTIDDYRIIKSSIVFMFNNRIIKHRSHQVWKGDYIIMIGKFPNFSVMGKNIIGSSGYRQNTGIHPHVNSNGLPCLATYNSMVVTSLNDRNWIQFTLIVSDFLSQYNKNSPYIRL